MISGSKDLIPLTACGQVGFKSWDPPLMEHEVGIYSHESAE